MGGKTEDPRGRRNVKKMCGNEIRAAEISRANLAEDWSHPLVHVRARLPEEVVDATQVRGVEHARPLIRDEIADSVQGVG